LPSEAPEGISERDNGGKRGSIMGDGIQINRVAERFSSHTLSHSRPSGHRTSGTSSEAQALREKLIAAMVEVVAEGGDPRLV
jgi:hypothetical protein